MTYTVDICQNQDSHSFTDKKFQDFSRTPMAKIFQNLFVTYVCLNIIYWHH